MVFSSLHATGKVAEFYRKMGWRTVDMGFTRASLHYPALSGS
jgi:hypothetical protein